LQISGFCSKEYRMTTYPAGCIAVIFVAQRTGGDDAGYGVAAGEMSRLAAAQPGYAGIDSVRDAGGLGITVSYWADEAAALAWRDNARHTAIRDLGRDRWYSHYSLHVAEIARSYDWTTPG
jgi:heme-degrading monooxygenase HmoA